MTRVDPSARTIREMERDRLIAHAITSAGDHHPTAVGCSCGFAVYSQAHVIVSSIRDAWAAMTEADDAT